MCGIVAVLRRRAPGDPFDLGAATRALDEINELLATAGVGTAEMIRAASQLHALDRELLERNGVAALVADPVARAALDERVTRCVALVAAVENRLDTDVAAGTQVEKLNAALVDCKDALWALGNDRVGAARAIEDLVGGSSVGDAAIAAFHSIQIALSALDRLEVRGRDSAGLHVLVTGHGLALDDPTVASFIAARSRDELFGATAVRAAGNALSFVYKTAAEIGELGDNTARLRAQIRDDELLRLALRADAAEAVVLSHTRWASVGIISEANAHPLNSEESGVSGRPYVVAALNGDVDNYADLKALEGLQFPAEITTDAKVIPALVARRLEQQDDAADAFRNTVASFEGSVAIAAQVVSEPGRLLLAQRGSGQALYVGFGPDLFVVASEPYGIIAECDSYLRLDGESMLEPGNPTTQGQVVVLDRAHAGALTGVRRMSYDGRALPVETAELQTPQITTRDVDRGDAPHYLLKEIIEAPASFRKTLRGKIVERDGLLDVQLPSETLTDAVRARLRDGSITRVLAIGQGTAAIAGQSFAHVLRRAAAVNVEAMAATELSGFGLGANMRDTLVVAISQSGTTADTNRTVDLARARGALVIAIVNRRNSDLVEKADGVLYTSDGRDVEMSVASTKAFYSQIAAGLLLAFALAGEISDETDARVSLHERLVALRELPGALAELVQRRPTIAAVAQRTALNRRSWAIVGNGVNRVAAQEIRIKLSELC